MTQNRFDDFTKSVFKSALRDAFAITPIANTLIGLLGAWGSYAMITSGLFIPASEVHPWLMSSTLLWIMGAVSILSILAASTKSLIPAAVIWLVGIVLIFLKSSLVLLVFVLAVVSATLFRMFGSR